MGHALAPRLKPIHLVVISLAALGAIAVVTTLATFQRTAPTRVSGSRPAGAQLQIPTEISGTVVDDAPDEPTAQVSSPRRSSGQAGSGTGAAAQAPAVGGGGDTNVTIDNGSSDTSTESGGSNVNNSAAVSARTGSGAGGEEP